MISVLWSNKGAKIFSAIFSKSLSRGSVLPKQSSKYGSSDSPRQKLLPIHFFSAKFNAACSVWFFISIFWAYSKDDSGKKCNGSDIPCQKSSRKFIRKSLEFVAQANSQAASLHIRKLLAGYLSPSNMLRIRWYIHVFNRYFGFVYAYRIWIRPCSWISVRRPKRFSLCGCDSLPEFSQFSGVDSHSQFLKI